MESTCSTRNIQLQAEKSVQLELGLEVGVVDPTPPPDTAASSPQPQPPQLASSGVSAKAITSQRVFISYRSQQPDAGLAQEFYNQLVAAGHEAFMAGASISWGQNWVERIDEELKRCDYFRLIRYFTPFLSYFQVQMQI